MSELESAGNDGTATVPDQRPGRMLADARADKKLSVAEVAQQLKLSTGQIEALEADAYDRLPGPVFVRGFVRNYARLLDLDGESLVATLNMRFDSAPASVAVPHSHNIPFPDQRPVKWPRYAAGLLLLVIGVALFEFFFSAPSTVVVLPSAPEVAPLVAEPVPVIEPPALVPVASEEKPEEKITEVAAAVPAAPAKRKDMAELHFDAESWVAVRDGKDRLLFSQLNPAGTEYHLQAKPPLSVVVGNARGARLLYNGQPFDLAPHTRVEVARFTLE
jgi:cytoskeleton protein RodZ